MMDCFLPPSSEIPEVDVSELAYSQATGWVGKSKFSNQCNAFVSQVYSDAGYSISPSGFANDFESNSNLIPVTTPKRGDIVQFDKGVGQIPHGHVAIFAGDNQMITTSSGKIIRFQVDAKAFRITGSPTLRYLRYKQ